MKYPPEHAKPWHPFEQDPDYVDPVFPGYFDKLRRDDDTLDDLADLMEEDDGAA